MFKKFVLNFPRSSCSYSLMSFKSAYPRLLKKTIKKPIVCDLCSQICKEKIINKKCQKEEFYDVDEADKEEFSNKWNLPRNSP